MLPSVVPGSTIYFAPKGSKLGEASSQVTVSAGVKPSPAPAPGDTKGWGFLGKVQIFTPTTEYNSVTTSGVTDTGETITEPINVPTVRKMAFTVGNVSQTALEMIFGVKMISAAKVPFANWGETWGWMTVNVLSLNPTEVFAEGATIATIQVWGRLRVAQTPEFNSQSVLTIQFEFIVAKNALASFEEPSA